MPASQSANARWRAGENASKPHTRHARAREGNVTGSQGTSCREHAHGAARAVATTHSTKGRSKRALWATTRCDAARSSVAVATSIAWLARSSSVRPVMWVISGGTGRPGSWRQVRVWSRWTSVMAPFVVYVNGSIASSMSASCSELKPVVSQSTYRPRRRGPGPAGCGWSSRTSGSRVRACTMSTTPAAVAVQGMWWFLCRLVGERTDSRGSPSEPVTD